MNKNKWQFAQVDPNETPPEKIERGGMIVVGIIGLILLVAGLLLVWKTGAYNFEFFGNGSKHSYFSNSSSTERDILFLMNLPWMAGAAMCIAAVRHFFRKRR